MRMSLLSVALLCSVVSLGWSADTPAEKKAKRLKAKAAAKPPAVTPAAPTAKTPAPAATNSPVRLNDVSKTVDTRIAAKLVADGVKPSPTCTDEEFVRRAYLDITGVIPTAEQAKAFLGSTAGDKRAQLIDTLLASPNYARHQADVWMDILVDRSSDNRFIDFKPFRDWLTEKFAANTPWDVMVSELVTASGPYEKNPAVGFYLSQSTVDKMTDRAGQAFLGNQLQCAQCHDHKFNDWKQTDYWSMAAFFINVDVAGQKKDQTPGVREVPDLRRGKRNELPESAKMVPAKFLQGDTPPLASDALRRPILAAWMTSRTNPFFAKAMVNRVWAGLFGRGLVNPVDDMVGENIPSHPELLSELADDFAAGGFDVRRLIRGLTNTAVYQRSTRATAGNGDTDASLYARRAVKVMTPEQLFESVSQVVGFESKATKGKPAPKGVNVSPKERFTTFFRAGADTLDPVSYEAGIPQALKLMNSKPLNGGPAVIRQLIGDARGVESLDRMYLATLARRPTPAEVTRLTAHLSAEGNSSDAYADILWALLNGSEFTLIR